MGLARRSKTRNGLIKIRWNNRKKIIRVLYRQCNICPGCGEKFKGINDPSISIDHIVRVKDGGPDEYWNLRLMHRPCNSKREKIKD